MHVREYSVDCYINGFQDFYHLSHVHAGLLELQRSERIRLHFRFSKPVHGLANDPPWTPWLKVRGNSTGESRLIVLDLSDHSKHFDLEALKHCDVYFKRNLFEPDLECIAESLRARVQPFGLHYHCRTKGQTVAILRRAVPQLLLQTLSHPREDLQHFGKRLRKLREFVRMLPIADYEQPPNHPVDPMIFFQPRVSTHYPNAEEELIRPRVDLVRALRKEFGKRFLGGLAPNAYAKSSYPDLVSPYSGRPVEYISMGKRALVAVNSIPCVRTGSMKIAEHLAASRCMVSPPMRNRLPTPLSEGQHYLGYRTLDECVDRCSLLFENRKLAEEMRHRNWQYYVSEVAPAQHMENLFARAFNSPVEHRCRQGRPAPKRQRFAE